MPTRVAIVAALAIAAAALVALPDEPARVPAPEPTAAHAPLAGSSGHGRENCSSRSEADFPGAFTSSRNLVVGPFALIGGGAYTNAETVREFGGNKFPAVLRPGRTVTVRLAGKGRRLGGLAYGRLPQGELKLRDTYRRVTFKACRRGGPSESSADGAEITFWSGFVLTRKPACIPLDVIVGDEPPARVRIALGRRCDG